MPVSAAAGASVAVRTITATSFDLPAVPASLRGRRYRFAYGTGDHTRGVWWNSLVKVDMSSGKTLEWFREDHYASEPNFIPRPDGTAEDDGVLVSSVLAWPINTTVLLVLDARTMVEVATIRAPHVLPYVSHGFAEH